MDSDAPDPREQDCEVAGAFRREVSAMDLDREIEYSAHLASRVLSELMSTRSVFSFKEGALVSGKR